MKRSILCFTLLLLSVFIRTAPIWATPEEDFLSALRDSRLRDARFFLDSHSPDTILPGGEQALIIMARENRSREVRWLVEQGADPNLPGAGEWSALMEASRQGNRNIVQILLQAGAEINYHPSDGTTALLAAVNSGRRELASYLEEQGGRILGGYFDHPYLDEIWTRRQHYARALELKEKRWKHHDFLDVVVNGSYRELEDKLAEGEDPGATDTAGVTALMLAASRTDAYLGRLLLSRSADPAARDEMDLTALWFAAFTDNRELMEDLLEKDPALVNGGVESYLESSPLFGAFSSSSYNAMEMLLTAGARTDLKGRMGAGLVHYAALCGDLRTIRILMEAGTDPGALDDKGRSALDLLILGYNLGDDESRYLPVASFLKEEGVRATDSPSVLDNVKLSRIIYSKW